MIHYVCRKCGAAMASPESMAGKFEVCPQCGASCVVAAKQSGQPPPTSAPPARPAPPAPHASEHLRSIRVMLRALVIWFIVLPVAAAIAVLLAWWYVYGRAR